MAEKDEIIKEKVKHSGLGDFKAAYSYAHDWIKENKGFDLTEEEYEEKIAGNARDIKIKWKASKEITDYFKIQLEVKWEVKGMTDVEVQIDKEKKQMNKFGEISIEVKGTLVKDYKNAWSAKPTHKFFKELYQKYVIPQRISDKSGEVTKLVQDFKEEMKALFELTARRK